MFAVRLGRTRQFVCTSEFMGPAESPTFSYIAGHYSGLKQACKACAIKAYGRLRNIKLYQLIEARNLKEQGPFLSGLMICVFWKVGRKLVEVPEELRRPCRFNDGKASPVGTFIVGTMHDKWMEGQPAQMFRMAGKPMGPHTLEQACPCTEAPVLITCHAANLQSDATKLRVQKCCAALAPSESS